MKQSFKAKRRTTHNATRTPSERDNTALPILHAAKALLYVLGISLLLLSATSLIAYFSPDPDTLVMPLGLGVAALSSFLGGYLTLRMHRRAALVCGLSFAILLTLVSFPLGVLLSSRGVAYPLWLSCALRTSVFALSVAGAFCALRRTERPPKTKRHRHA